MIVLINSSKTMANGTQQSSLRQPRFLAQAQIIHQALVALDEQQLRKIMHISPNLAHASHQLIARWSTPQAPSGAALDMFTGDIYRTLRANTFSGQDRAYADGALRILSGQYGILQPLDTIQPYRLEIGYKLTVGASSNLYEFWGDQLARSLPRTEILVNAASEEYFKAIKPYVSSQHVISPLFLTQQAAPEPAFVAIHAKWARGAFARWMIVQRIAHAEDIPLFSELGYCYQADQSTPQIPVFVRPA